MAAANLIADIDSRIEFVHGQILLGAKRDDLFDDQHKALMATIGKTRNLSIADVTKVSQHLAESGKWKQRQQEAFSACLRTAAARFQRLHQPSRSMQQNEHLVYYFLPGDWGKLNSETDIRDMEQTLVIRMHKFGTVSYTHLTLPTICSV